MPIFISTPNGLVSGFSARHLVVVTTLDPKQAKSFKTEAAARKYLRPYLDAGYGLSSSDVTFLVDSSFSR